MESVNVCWGKNRFWLTDMTFNTVDMFDLHAWSN